MKIRISLPVIAFLAVCASEFVVAQAKPNTGSAIILGLEAKWNAAFDRGDIATMNTLLADDFIITVEDGSPFSKSTVHVEISDMSDLKVRMHGKTAVVTGAYHEKGTSKGKPYEYRDRFTDVWMNMNGRGRLSLLTAVFQPAHSGRLWNEGLAPILDVLCPGRDSTLPYLHHDGVPCI